MRKLSGAPLVSVIIPTLNSEKFLRKCLSSLKKQTYSNLEIIIVDDGSTDSTLKIAESYGCRIVKNPKKGRAEAKNEGMRQALGEYLVFIDSDMELTPRVIEECISIVKNIEYIGGIVIPERSIGKSFWVKVRDFERSFYAESVIESARFFPAKLVKKVGGFEEGLIFFEEATLPFKIAKMGYNVMARIESCILHHENNFSLIKWLKKKFNYGKTVNLYKTRYPEYIKVQLSPWARLSIFLRNWRRFFSRPKLALGVIILKSFEFFSIISGLFYSKLSFQVLKR